MGEKQFYEHVTLVCSVIVYGAEMTVDEKTRGVKVSGVGRKGKNLAGQPKTKSVENCVKQVWFAYEYDGCNETEEQIYNG